MSDNQDFGQDDSSVPRQEKKKRVMSRESSQKAASRKKKKTNLEIDKSVLLSTQVQEWFDTQLANVVWVPSLSSQLRTNARYLLREAMKKNPEYEIKKSKSEMIVWAMEQTAYDNWFLFHPVIYAQRVRNVSFFIAKEPVKFLTIDPSFAMTMEDVQLAQYKVDTARKEEYYSQSFNKSRYEAFMKNNIYGEGDIMCRKCKKRGCVQPQNVQTRGADEPTTVFYHCTDCDKRWKEV